jgi:hypothetical protein
MVRQNSEIMKYRVTIETNVEWMQVMSQVTNEQSSFSVYRVYSVNTDNTVTYEGFAWLIITGYELDLLELLYNYNQL